MKGSITIPCNISGLLVQTPIPITDFTPSYGDVFTLGEGVARLVNSHDVVDVRQEKAFSCLLHFKGIPDSHEICDVPTGVYGDLVAHAVFTGRPLSNGQLSHVNILLTCLSDAGGILMGHLPLRLDDNGESFVGCAIKWTEVLTTGWDG